MAALHHFLSDFPDQSTTDFLVHGFSFGFDIGFTGLISPSIPKNLLSAQAVPDGVTAAISTELSRGHTAGPFVAPPFDNFHCSPIGAVEKPDGSVRLILDLSSPRGNSVNEGIPADMFSVVYSRFDDAVDLVRTVGVNGFMAKIDVKHAFRLCPVRQSDLPLLCFSWQDLFYVELRLPFGSRSSPFIFNSFADAVCWIIIFHFQVRLLVHYLDDYFTISSSLSDCQSAVHSILRAFSALGIPVAVEKLVGPSRRLTYLGIEIDSRAQAIRLPQSKLVELRTLIRAWKLRKKCTKRELLSLIGKLSFASKVIKPGRMFLRRFIDLSTTVVSLHHHIHLNKEVQADFKWWDEFLVNWHGVSIIQQPIRLDPAFVLATDASLHTGLGGVFGSHWFHASWPTSFAGIDIAPKELFAIWVAISLWHDRLSNRQVSLFTDNMACAQVWVSGSAKDPNMLRFLRPLFFLCASHNINLSLFHIDGHHNLLADFLSRFQLDRFREAHPHADAQTTPIPDHIWDI